MADGSDSSSDSDDDYLTIGDDKTGKLDREALVRKKLLENFYGKSAVAAAGLDKDETDDLEDADEEDSPTKPPPAKRSSTLDSEVEDLDSPNFDAQAHIRRHVLESSVHTLLETEEKLALEVRTLDSTMQTMVYENYSRFIDATDAIRSIGVNVQANEEGLARLTESMQRIDDRSREVEDALGSLRDQVAEKIRIKRLLTRLDALLKLPKTLKEQIAAGKYRTATRSYLSASSILSKHSEGFESLKTIETECNTILKELRVALKQKLLHWSGHLNSLGQIQDDEDAVPDPPKNMAEIFEAAGTLYILLQNESESECLESELDADELQSMAMSACGRALDRILDTHLIEVQERRFSSPMDEGPLDISLPGSVSGTERMEQSKGNSLIPRAFLDAILEAATLYGMSFGTGGGGGYLMEFVSEAFASFLAHVRSVLLEESAQAASRDDTASPEDFDAAYEEISGALSLLVQSVRELASGLALPDVGISVDFASNLVDQTMDLTESMVRRRVDQKFHDLRLSCVKECLVPFAERAVAERANASTPEESVLPQIVQLASSTLSDCLQLVDDTIRSIFSGGLVIGESATSPDLPILKEAVQASTYRFASWLASALELLAGGESGDATHIIEASIDTTELQEGEEDDVSGIDIQTNDTTRDDVSDIGQEEAVMDLVDSAIEELHSVGGGSGGHSDFILAIAEMCRLAERSVSENLNQSIATHLGGEKKKSRGLFPTGEGSSPKRPSEQEDAISQRFLLASSRVLVLYATNRGSEAALYLCEALAMRTEQEEVVQLNRPSDGACQTLEIAKSASLECASILGGDKRAGPVPTMEDDSVSGFVSPSMARKSGLGLDVERMFKEKVTIFPHPSEIIDFSCSAILFVLFKVAFRAATEQVRMKSFSSAGFRQLQVDSEFLKHMMPHYIKSDYTYQGTNACSALSNVLSDVLENVGERCMDETCADNDDLHQESREVVRAFVAKMRDDQSICASFVISED